MGKSLLYALSAFIGIYCAFLQTIVSAKPISINVEKILSSSKFIVVGEFRTRTAIGGYYISVAEEGVIRGGGIGGHDLIIWPSSSGPRTSSDAIQETKGHPSLFIINYENEVSLIGSKSNDGFLIRGFNDRSSYILNCKDHELCKRIGPEISQIVVLDIQVLKKRFRDRIQLHLNGEDEFVIYRTPDKIKSKKFSLKLTLTTQSHKSIAIEFTPMPIPRTSVNLIIQREWGPFYRSSINLPSITKQNIILVEPKIPLSLEFDVGFLLKQVAEQLEFNYKYLISIEIDPRGWAGEHRSGVLTHYIQSNLLKVYVKYK